MYYICCWHGCSLVFRRPVGNRSRFAVTTARPTTRCVTPTPTAWPWTTRTSATLWEPCRMWPQTLPAAPFPARLCPRQAASPSPRPVSQLRAQLLHIEAEGSLPISVQHRAETDWWSCFWNPQSCLISHSVGWWTASYMAFRYVSIWYMYMAWLVYGWSFCLTIALSVYCISRSLLSNMCQHAADTLE